MHESIWSWWMVEWNREKQFFEIHKLAAALEMNYQARRDGKPPRPCMPEAIFESMLDAKEYVKAKRLEIAVMSSECRMQNAEEDHGLRNAECGSLNAEHGTRKAEEEEKTKT